MKKQPGMEVIAVRFGKHDMERLGLFTEMPYLPANGKRSKKDKKKKKNGDNKVMLAPGPKTKCGNMDGYFDNEFKRIFNGEIQGKKAKKKGKGKKDVPYESKFPFIPTGPQKKHSCPGDFFGTFGPILTEFSPKQRSKPEFRSEKANPVTNPGKKGGPGYINITIGKYPEYKGGKPRKPQKTVPNRAGPFVYAHYTQALFEVNPYRDPKHDPPTKRLYIPPKEPNLLDEKLLGRPLFVFTGPGKWMGGCKAGTFSKYPDWKKEKYLTPSQQMKVLSGPPKPFYAGQFYPHSYGYKTMFTTSVLYNTDYSMNSTNYKVYEPTYVKRLLKNVY